MKVGVKAKKCVSPNYVLLLKHKYSCHDAMEVTMNCHSSWTKMWAMSFCGQSSTYYAPCLTREELIKYKALQKENMDDMSFV